MKASILAHTSKHVSHYGISFKHNAHLHFKQPTIFFTVLTLIVATLHVMYSFKVTFFLNMYTGFK